MADKIPQLDESGTELEPQAINSRVKGYEAMASVFGQVAQSGAEQVKKMATEQSQVNFLQSSNLAENLKDETQINIINDPNHALQIADNSRNTFDTIKQSASLNKADRARLDYTVNRNMGAINVKAAEINHQQANRIASGKFFDGYATAVNQGLSALQAGDNKTAEAKFDSVHEGALQLLNMGAITPAQYAKIRQTTLAVHDRAIQDYAIFHKKGGATALDYQKASSPAIGEKPMGNAGNPIDGNTQYLTEHYNNDRTVQGQYAAAVSGKAPDIRIISQLKDKEHDKFMAEYAGIQAINNDIAVGTPYNLMDAQIKALENQPSDKLSPYDRGRIDRWKMINANGRENALSLIASNGHFQQATIDHLGNVAAIRKSNKDPNQMAEAIRQEDNNYIGVKLATFRASHIDPSLINPIDKDMIDRTQSSFSANAPVLPALQEIAYLDPQYRAYLANSMSKPNEVMTTWYAGLLANNRDQTFTADLFSANQEPSSELASVTKNVKGQNSTALILSNQNNAATDKQSVWGDISSDSRMKNIMSYLGTLPKGLDMQRGFKQMALNYVYYRGQKLGDTNLDNKDQYENEFMDHIGKANNFYRSSHAFLDLNVIPLTTKNDADMVINSALSQAYRNIHQGMDEQSFQRYLDLNPLMVTSSPDGRLVVTDNHGRSAMTMPYMTLDKDGHKVEVASHEAFDMPYTKDMLSHAIQQSKLINAYTSKYGGEVAKKPLSIFDQPDDQSNLTMYQSVMAAQGDSENQTALREADLKAKEEANRKQAVEQQNKTMPAYQAKKLTDDEKLKNETEVNQKIPGTNKVKKPMNENQEAVDLIKDNEGFRSTAYKKEGDVWTIGYGTTENVKHGLVITVPEAEKRLNDHLKNEVEPLLNKKVKVNLNTHQKSVLMSMMYVTGHIPTDLLNHINEGNFGTFEQDMRKYYQDVVKAHPEKKRFLQGWYNRTKREAAIFNKK